MKKFFLIMFVLLTSYKLSFGQSNSESLNVIDRSRVDNYLFLLDYFKNDTKKTTKYWNEAQAGMKMIVFVSINERPQHLDVLDLADTFKIAFTTIVSAGAPGHPTPLGDTKIYSKLPDLYSPKYNCTMTYWNNIHLHGKIGIHGLTGLTYEDKLGNPASHGCIRLSKKSKADAIFWHLVPVGTKVVVY